jgi:flagellar basal body P-ring protein FlgI
MSLKTWKKEFFGGLSRAKRSEKAAVEHSLKKWIGLRPENLAKHGVKTLSLSYFPDDVTSDAIASDDTAQLIINSESCALCARHSCDCEKCSITQQRLGYDCDQLSPVEMLSPFSAWRRNSDPEPMIEVLQAIADDQIVSTKASTTKGEANEEVHP